MACGKCHPREYESWQQTAMAHAFDLLLPGKHRQEKLAGGFDPDFDYSRDPECLRCHTTGYGHPGGYTPPTPGDVEAALRAEQRRGVGCEGCHGPGSDYVRLFRRIHENQQPYDLADLRAAGLWEVTADICRRCHSRDLPPGHPTQEFDFERRLEQGVHELFPLTLRRTPTPDGNARDDQPPPPGGN